jgi:hypothetical protein
LSKLLISISLRSVSGDFSFFFPLEHLSISLFSLIVYIGFNVLDKATAPPSIVRLTSCRRNTSWVSPAKDFRCPSNLCVCPSHCLSSWWPQEIREYWDLSVPWDRQNGKKTLEMQLEKFEWQVDVLNPSIFREKLGSWNLYPILSV